MAGDGICCCSSCLCGHGGDGCCRPTGSAVLQEEFPLVRGRCIRGRIQCFLAGHGGEGGDEDYSTAVGERGWWCFCCPPSRVDVICFLLADRGGEGEGEDGRNATAAGIGRCWCESDPTLVVQSWMSTTLTSSSCELHCYSSSCRALHPMRATVHGEYVFFLFGTCRRRVRASLDRKSVV